MTSRRHAFFTGLLLAWAIFSNGCGQQTQGPPAALIPPSPALIEFRDRHAPTLSVHGKVTPLSLEQKGEYIHYQTEDGKKWRVHCAESPDEFTFGVPELEN